MGYKLAGFDVVGCVEIDQDIAKVYSINLNPRHLWQMDIREFNKRIASGAIEVGPIDVLDGSPPCSSFSMAGSREKYWGKEKKFREGQSMQVLDDLFFDFIETARLLKPKVIIAENVLGMIYGNGKGYVLEIFKRLKSMGYRTQLFKLDSSRMGVPQKRNRIFFVATNLDVEPLKMNFHEPAISVQDAFEGIHGMGESKALSGEALKWWKRTSPGHGFNQTHPKGSWFNWPKLSRFKPAPCLTAAMGLNHWSEPRQLSEREYIMVQSFPEDYNFIGMEAKYICGMSVPPYMMKGVAEAVMSQWLAPRG